jgi:hypothetical protein
MLRGATRGTWEFSSLGTKLYGRKSVQRYASPVLVLGQGFHGELRCRKAY